jgi:hypothetical protein
MWMWMKFHSIFRVLALPALLAIPASQLTALPAAAENSSLYAVVNSSGILVRGSNVAGFNHPGPGLNEVAFNRDVSNCSYTATLGEPGNAPLYTAGLVFTSSGPSGVNGVYVETKNLGGGLFDLPFHLNVSCDNEWAVVSANGSLARGGGVLLVDHSFIGVYEVMFERDVSNCAYTATIGDWSTNHVYDLGLVFTAGGHKGPTGVYVETKNMGGGLTDFPFHLNVTCTSTWAVVRVDGTDSRDLDVVATTHAGPGRYEVTFNHDISNCAFIATIGDPNARYVYDPGLVSTSGAPNGVYVDTMNLVGVLTDAPFHLNVSCGPYPIFPIRVTKPAVQLAVAPKR